MEHLSLKEKFEHGVRKFQEIFKNALLDDSPPVKNGVFEASPTVKSMKEFSEKYRLSSLLPYERYDETNELYYNKDTVGFMLIANPATKLNVQDIGILNEIFNYQHRPKTSIQVTLYSDTAIDNHLTAWSEHKSNCVNSSNSEMFKLMAEKRVEYLASGKFKSLFVDEKQMVRNISLIISYTIPLHAEGVSNETLDFLKRVRMMFEGVMRSVAIGPINLSPEMFLNTMNSFFNPSYDRHDKILYDEENVISSQMVDRDTMFLLGPGVSSIVHQEKEFSMIPLHAKQFPRNWRAYLNSELIGSFVENERRMSCPYMMTLTVNVPDQINAKGKSKANFARSTQMSKSQIASFVPQWNERKEDWGFVTKRLEGGDKLLDAFFQIILLTPKGKEEEAVQNTKNIFKQNQWILSNTRYIPLHALLGALPMGVSQEIYHELKSFGHYSSRLSWNCTNIAPWIGEWKGTKTPMMVFTGRKGQISFFNPYDNTKGNYNMACLATSGSGKSVFTQEWIYSALGAGGRAFVIDSGGSYKNICEMLGGTYIDFGAFTPKLNIFSKIFSKENLERVEQIIEYNLLHPHLITKDDYKSTKDYIADFLPMLIDIVTTMASPREGLTQIQRAYLEKAISSAVEKKWSDTTITTVAEELVQISKEEIELGIEALKVSIMLRPYTKEGMFGKYFEGENNINLNNDFVVLEMDALKDKGDLRNVVLQILITQINQVMYLSGNRSQIKLVLIDEAFELLKDGRYGAFIEKGYRQARKFRGSYMTIVQKTGDYHQSEVALASLMCSDHIIYLRQKNEDLLSALEKKQIDNSDGKVDILKTLKTEAGKYSELAISSPDGMAVLRFCIDPMTQKLYSTTPEEVAFIKIQRERGATLLEAVECLLHSQTHH